MRAIGFKLVVIGFVVLQVFAQNLSAQDDLSLPGGPVPTNATPRIFSLAQEIQVVVQLVDAPLARAHGKNAKAMGGRLAAAQQRDYVVQLGQKQDALLAQIRNLGGRDQGRLNKALNAVVVTIAASRVSAIAALPGVRTVRPLRDYQMDLSETVPYIGARAVQNVGIDGRGVRVAVLDSGIDYTHKFFGGPGTAAAYTNAYGTTTTDPRNKTTDGLFPTRKVVGGYDFIGEGWPTTPAVPDPDPIDCGPSAIPAPCAGGHGTHVADIIAGNDGDDHKGVAPGASLYALKVCSAVASSCNGLALLQAMDYALDPDGDGDISDAVDVINMSLGSSYGQIQDDLSEASTVAVELGVVVVAAAGNSGDRPYIVGSPSIAPQAISVAQTQVPSAVQHFMRIVSPAAIAGNYIAVHQSWSAQLMTVIQRPMQYGNGAGLNLDGCAAFPAGSLTGKIVLVDRGTCNFSDKIRNIQNGGGEVGVIGLIAPGEPFDGAFGGGPPITIPGFMIHQSTSTAIKNQLAANTPVVARFDPNNKVSLARSMVSGSSRGPSYSFNSIKPDIGAPGASRSALAGTGTGESPFSGTSGASPMVAGSAALLIHAQRSITPLDVKARLMNTAEINIQTNPATMPGVLAPITRIGSGEVRVNRAVSLSTTAWDAEDEIPSLSFGYHALNQPKIFRKTVALRNHTNNSRTYLITPSFRYASDANGAVEISAPRSIFVPGRGTAEFKVRLEVKAKALPVWTLNGGARGGDGFRLQEVEFDGFITLTSSSDTVRLPWHILPHKAADVTPHRDEVRLQNGGANIVLNNEQGAIDGRVDIFALLGKSRKIPKRQLPGPGDNFAIIDMKAVGARLINPTTTPSIEFAITTFGMRSHPNYPAEFDIYIDSNRDGVPDYVVFNLENGGFAVTGQNVVAVANLANNTATIFTFADADLDSANIIMRVPLSSVGLTPNTQFDFSVYAFDNYFTGELTDAIEDLTFTPGTPRYTASGVPATGVPAGGVSRLRIESVPGGDAASPSQTGILLMYRDAKKNQEADAIKVNP
jgi:minor extracellular serine protease Vpr